MKITGRLEKIERFLEALVNRKRIKQEQIGAYLRNILCQQVDKLSQQATEKEIDAWLKFFNSETGQKLMRIEKSSETTTFLTIKDLLFNQKHSNHSVH